MDRSERAHPAKLLWDDRCAPWRDSQSATGRRTPFLMRDGDEPPQILAQAAEVKERVQGGCATGIKTYAGVPQDDKVTVTHPVAEATRTGDNDAGRLPGFIDDRGVEVNTDDPDYEGKLIVWLKRLVDDRVITPEEARDMMNASYAKGLPTRRELEEKKRLLTEKMRDDYFAKSGFDDSGRWVYEGKSGNRAKWRAGKGATIQLLAYKVKLDEAEASAWLRYEDGSPWRQGESVKEGATYTVPNLIVVVVGECSPQSRPYLRGGAEALRSAFMDKDYEVLVLNVEDSTGLAVLDEFGKHAHSDYMWGFAFFGHGAKELPDRLRGKKNEYMGHATLTQTWWLAPDVRISPVLVGMGFRKGFVFALGCYTADADWKGATAKYGRTWEMGGPDFVPLGAWNLGAESFAEVAERSAGLKSPRGSGNPGNAVTGGAVK